MTATAGKIDDSDSRPLELMVNEKYTGHLSVKDLHQFDAPSSPEKWERVWTEVEAA